MKKLLLVLLLALITVSLVITGCNGDETTAPTTTSKPTTTTAKPTETTEPTTTAEPTATEPSTPYGTLTAASADFGYESTDPIFYESLWGWCWYDSLLRYDENGQFIPGVADEWSLEGNTWTFKIHEGIKFHNGDPLTAHDVKFSVDRFSDMSQSSNPWSYYISNIYNQVETKVVDDYTFQFVADHPEPAQLIVFAWTRILPKNYFESVGQDGFRAAPIGSGPWKFVELVSETQITMEANTEYWRPDEIPNYQYYVELQVPEEATRIAMLKTGEIDIAYGITYDRIPDLTDQGYQADTIGLPTLSNIAIQGSWLPEAGPVGDIRIRQALSYALNREEIAETWYGGFAKPGGQFYMHSTGYGYTDYLATDEYNPDKAKALMAEAGYPDDYADPTIHIYSTAAGQDYHLLLQSYWQAVGLDVQVEIVDSTIYTSYYFNFERIKEGDPNVGWMFTWTFPSFFNSTYHCANMYTSWGVHNCGNDPAADELYLKASGETDLDLAVQYYAEFQQYARDMYVNIGIVEADTIIVSNPETVGDWTGRNWVSYQDALNGITHP